MGTPTEVPQDAAVVSSRHITEAGLGDALCEIFYSDHIDLGEKVDGLAPEDDIFAFLARAAFASQPSGSVVTDCDEERRNVKYLEGVATDAHERNVELTKVLEGVLATLKGHDPRAIPIRAALNPLRTAATEATR